MAENGEGCCFTSHLPGVWVKCVGVCNHIEGDWV